jgi:ELWxxDGT repeat protein
MKRLDASLRAGLTHPCRPAEHLEPRVLLSAVRVADMPSTNPTPLVEVDGRVLFTSGRLYITDGSAAGAMPVSESAPRELVGIDGRAVFPAATPQTGNEPFRTDGSRAGTSAVDASPGPTASNPAGLRAAAHHVFFTGSNATEGPGLRLMALDPAGGEVESLRQVSEIVPFVAGAGPYAYFNAPLDPPASGVGLFRSDGTAGGTTLVREGTTFSSALAAELGGVLYFYGANAGGTPGLMKTDGTSAGTVPVAAVRMTSSANFPPHRPERGRHAVLSRRSPRRRHRRRAVEE